MKTFIYFLIFVVVFSFKLNAWAGKILIHNTTLKSNFEGVIKNFQTGDSLYVIYSDDGPNAGVSNHEWLTLKIVPDSIGKFSFSLPGWNATNRMVLQFKRGHGGWDQFGDYIVERGDNIFIEIQTANNLFSSSFSGARSAKYNCVSKLHNPWFDIHYPPNLALSENSPEYWMDGLFSSIDSMRLKDLDVLKRLQTKISPTVAELLREEISARYYEAFVVKMQAYLFLSKHAFVPGADTILKRYLKMYDATMSKTVHLSNISKSANLRQFVICNIRLQLAIKYNRQPSLEEIFNYIRDMYQGINFDKLVSQLVMYDPLHYNVLVAYKKGSDEYCYAEGVKLIKNTTIKKVFESRARLQPGKLLYNFSLENMEGDTVRLDNLKGKVFLVDFWFTRCTGCANFYRLFRDSVEPILKKQENFEVVSIGIDRSRNQWLESVPKNIYTDTSHLNLFAGNNRSDMQCPFLDYYHVSGAPFIILVDKQGRILLSSIGGFSENIDSVKKVILDALNL